jgi:hypothetical protein
VALGGRQPTDHREDLPQGVVGVGILRGEPQGTLVGDDRLLEAALAGEDVAEGVERLQVVGLALENPPDLRAS